MYSNEGDIGAGMVRRAGAGRIGRKLTQRWRAVGLRAKLLVGALLLGTLPLVVAAIILPGRVQSTLTKAGHERLLQVSQGLATVTEQEIRRHQETVRSFAAVEALAGALRRHHAQMLSAAELAATNAQLRQMLRGLEANQYQGLFLSGADGLIFAGVLKNGDAAPYARLDVRDRPYFARLRATLQPVVSDPIKSKIGDVPIIVVAVPVLEAHGRLVGFVGLSVELEDLVKLISGQALGRTGYPFAVDCHGLVVAHPDADRVFKLNLKGQPGTARLAERMGRGETGIEVYTSSKGEEKLAAFAPVPIAGWSVAASMETVEFAEPARQLRWIIFAMIGACVVIAGVLAVTFAVGLEELKQALAQARASEARFKLFASVANETIWDWNLRTDEMWWSEGLTSAFGYAPAEMETNSVALLSRLRDDERDRIVRGLRGCRGGGTWSGEHHFRRRDGSFAYVLHRAVTVRDATGQAVRVIGGLTDISQRRLTEEKLAEQAALIDQAPDGIMVRDLNHAIQFWSRGAERLYGWSAAEVVGGRRDDLLGGEVAPLAEAAAAVMQRGEWIGRLKRRTKQGVGLTVDCRWTLLRDDRGQPKSILTIDTDVTEREKMEAKFLRAQRLESLGTLAGGIAHDLNNLLAPIVMGVDMLKLSERAEPDREVIQYIEQSAARGAQLVKQVLSFARGVEGARVAVHVGYVAREVEAMIRSTFPKNISLRLELPKDLWLVMADPTQLNQILLNLCVNARDAMPGGGQLTLAAQNIRLDEHFARNNCDVTPGPYVLLEVADTGTGIPPEVMERLFEPFFTTKAPGKGTGLGLSTVIGITRSHGGTINVYSEKDQGSVFKVYLPAASGALAGASEPALAEPVAAGHGELILLVDDEPSIRSVTKQALELFGYRVVVAADGAEALALYHRHRAELALVLTDMMMPIMDGAALIAALRHTDPGVVVVAASGLNDHNNQIKAACADIRHFLCKPYTTTVLLAVVKQALAEARSA